MKKCIFRIFLFCLSMILWASSALAAAPATLNQKMALRTGPSTAYAEMFTLPQSTEITAIEFEEGNGVTWVLVEFEYKGQRMRGYTGLKRMTVHGEIPWADHFWMSEQCIAGGEIYAAPSPYAAVRGELTYMEDVMLLGFDGDYVYIEYTDSSTGMPSRGWVYDWCLNISQNTYYGESLPPVPVYTGDVSISMRALTHTTLYSAPDGASATSIFIPAGAAVECFGILYCGFSIVEYDGQVGYVPTSFLTSLN